MQADAVACMWSYLRWDTAWWGKGSTCFLSVLACQPVECKLMLSVLFSVCMLCHDCPCQRKTDLFTNIQGRRRLQDILHLSNICHLGVQVAGGLITSKIDNTSLSLPSQPCRHLVVGGPARNHAVMSEYDKLQRALQMRCTEAASFLSQADLTAWQIVTCSNPRKVKKVTASPTDYAAFPNLSLAYLKQMSDQITLLLPFRDHVGASINIWKPFWNIDKEFSVRISRPVGSYKGEPVYYDMDRAYFSVVQQNGTWRHELQEPPDNKNRPLTEFERAADMFVQLLLMSEIV